MKTVSQTLLSVSICAALSGSAFAQATPAATKPEAAKPLTTEHAKAKPAKKSKLEAPAEAATSEHKGLPHAAKSEVAPKVDVAPKADKVAEHASKGTDQPVVKEAAHHDTKQAVKPAKPSAKLEATGDAKPSK